MPAWVGIRRARAKIKPPWKTSPVHMSACPRVHVPTCPHVHKSTCTPVHTCACPHVHMYSCPHVSTRSHVDNCVCAHVHIGPHMSTYVHMSPARTRARARVHSCACCGALRRPAAPSRPAARRPPHPHPPAPPCTRARGLVAVSAAVSLRFSAFVFR